MVRDDLQLYRDGEFGGVIMCTLHYVNLTNGIEAIPEIKGDYRYIRIQSTACEQHLWDKIIQDLDYDFLMNLALGNECIVYDYGANKPISRAMYQGMLFIEYVLYKHWLGAEYVPLVRRNNNSEGQNCERFFNNAYRNLDRKTIKKLNYFKLFIPKGMSEINIHTISRATSHDGDKLFYFNIIQEVPK